MFKLISPVAKVMALTLSVALTWSTMGTITEAFQHDGGPAQQLAQLPLVVVIGHRADLNAPANPVAEVRELPSGAKLTKMNPSNKEAAI